MITYGLQIPWFGSQPDGGHAAALRRIAETAEAGGFSSLWVADHLYQTPLFASASPDVLDCYTTLAYLGAVTSEVTLGAMVSGVVLRHPVALVKQVTSLDALTGGRAWLGVGAGWYAPEIANLGHGFPPMAERIERLEETLEIANRIWSGGEAFVGRHYQCLDTACSPAPVQRPHPPILVGGSSDRVLRIAARRADAFNVHGDPEQVQSHVATVRKHCDAIGRNPEAVTCSWLGSPHPGTNFVEQGRALARAGASMIVYNVPPAREVDTVVRFIQWMGREVIPAVVGAREVEAV